MEAARGRKRAGKRTRAEGAKTRRRRSAFEGRWKRRLWRLRGERERAWCGRGRVEVAREMSEVEERVRCWRRWEDVEEVEEDGMVEMPDGGSASGGSEGATTHARGL